VHGALDLIESRGPHRVEPADVIRHLSIPRARYRACFPRDLDLWAAVATWIRRRMRADWDRVLGNDLSPKAKLRSLVAVQVGVVAATPAIPALALGNPGGAGASTIQAALVEARQELRAILSFLLQEAKRAGETHVDLDTERAAEEILETVHGAITTRRIAAGSSPSISALWEKVDWITAAPRPGLRRRQAANGCVTAPNTSVS